MTMIRGPPTQSVAAVASATRAAASLNRAALAKKLRLQDSQKYAIIAAMVPACSMTRRNVISGLEGSSRMIFSAAMTWAELETGSSSAAPCTMPRTAI